MILQKIKSNLSRSRKLKSIRKQRQQREGRYVLPITWEVLSQIADTVGKLPAESGGAFGGLERKRTVSSFHFDKSSRTSAVTYSPDHKHLNRIFKTEWKPKGIRLKGFVHSHPGYMSRPSQGDEVYAERILRAIPDMTVLWLPIVNTVADTGDFQLTPWAATLVQGRLKIVRGELKILNVPKNAEIELAGLAVPRSLFKADMLNEIRIKGPARPVQPVASLSSAPKPQKKGQACSPVKPQEIVSTTFDRVQGVYDLPLMAQSRIIAVGAGGAAEWLEQLARAGVGQFVLIDPDTVSETNLATQQVYRRDIGRPKVDCIAERIRDINPTAKTIAIQKSLDDLDDEELARLANDPIDGRPARKTILCGLTDSFFAQARVNRLALHLGIPSLCGQVYREGRGCEITFTYPGVTPACNRCILSSRYRHYLEQRLENDVTSHGTPIFATARLNATKGFVALALLHHGTDHPRWGGMLARIGKRNLVVVRMDPDFGTSIGMPTFDKVFAHADGERLFFDETIWLPQDAESQATGHSPCPDCGGSGDLSQSIGRFETTVIDPGNPATVEASSETSAATPGESAPEDPMENCLAVSPADPRETNPETL